MRDILHKTDGSEPRIEADGGKYFNHDLVCVSHPDRQALGLLAELRRKTQKAAGTALVSCWRIRTAFPVPSQPAATRTAPRFWCSRAKAKLAQPDAALVRKADGFSEHLRNSGAGYQAYEQFSQHVVMPMVEAVVKLMAPHLSTKGAALALRVDAGDLATSKLTKEQLKLAFHLYCQLPFGKLHKGKSRKSFTLLS